MVGKGVLGKRLQQLLESLSKQSLIEMLHVISEAENIQLSKYIPSKDGLVLPSFIFVSQLSAFESVCKYLKETIGLSYHEIALHLQRNDRTIWTTYNNAKKKMPGTFKKGKIIFTVPLEIFHNRKRTILEHLVTFLKEELQYTYHQIAVLLHRDDRTIWTVYTRAKKKK